MNRAGKLPKILLRGPPTEEEQRAWLEKHGASLG